jgi:hypothetical protein
MRSTSLSTHVAKSSLRLIFDYGTQALSNRRKELFFIAFIFLFLPQIALTLVWAETSRTALESLAQLSASSPLAVFETVIQLLSNSLLPVGFLTLLLSLLGILALAQTSVDYFESKPSPIGNVLKRAGKRLLTKGLGTFLFFIVLFPVLAVLPLLRAVALSMLMMLPITLLVSDKGGFRTSWDTLFLKYSGTTRFGRWPIFFNVLSFAGIFLTILFGFIILIDFLKIVDTWLSIPAGLLESEVKIYNYNFGFAEFVAQLMILILNSAWFAVAMPFAAATYHLSTTPEDHVRFEATA